MAAPKGNKNALGNKGGRPTAYRPEYAEQARKMCLLGYTDKELAFFFEVDERTINDWKEKHLEFSLSIKEGKDYADSHVAERLFQRAMGFEHDSEEIKVVSDGQGLGSSIERIPIRKIYPPDTAAAIFWLKNRQKDKWREKIETEHTGKDGGPISTETKHIVEFRNYGSGDTAAV